jgi:hypothetical protein
LFWGVVKEGVRRGVFLGVCEKRKGWELGSRRARGSALLGEVKSEWVPEDSVRGEMGWDEDGYCSARFFPKTLS